VVKDVYLWMFLLGYCSWIHFLWPTSFFSSFTSSTMATRYVSIYVCVSFQSWIFLLLFLFFSGY
jgi:hypothetical protein